MERIIDRLKKIYELSVRGEEQEALAAKHALDKLLKKHTLTFGDISDESKKERCFKVPSGTLLIFLQCYGHLFGKSRINDIYRYKGERNKWYAKLTDVDCVDIRSLFDFHLKLYTKEKKAVLKNFDSAYVFKHNLYSQEPVEEQEYETEVIETDFVKIYEIAQGLSDIKYRRLIENH